MADFYSFRVAGIDGVVRSARAAARQRRAGRERREPVRLHAAVRRLRAPVSRAEGPALHRHRLSLQPVRRSRSRAPKRRSCSSARSTYNVTFPLSAKIDVNGPNRHPLYAWLTAPENGFPGDIAVEFREVPDRPPRPADRPLSLRARSPKTTGCCRTSRRRALSAAFNSQPFSFIARTPLSLHSSSACACGPLPATRGSWPSFQHRDRLRECERRRHVRVAHAAGLVQPIAEVLPRQHLRARHACAPRHAHHRQKAVGSPSRAASMPKARAVSASAGWPSQPSAMQFARSSFAFGIVRPACFSSSRIWLTFSVVSPRCTATSRFGRDRVQRGRIVLVDRALQHRLLASPGRAGTARAPSRSPDRRRPRPRASALRCRV